MFTVSLCVYKYWNSNYRTTNILISSLSDWLIKHIQNTFISNTTYKKWPSLFSVGLDISRRHVYIISEFCVNFGSLVLHTDLWKTCIIQKPMAKDKAFYEIRIKNMELAKFGHIDELNWFLTKLTFFEFFISQFIPQLFP